MRGQIDFSLTQEFRDFMASLPALEEAGGLIHGIFIDIHPLWKAIVDQIRRTGFFEGSLGILARPGDAPGIPGQYDPAEIAPDRHPAAWESWAHLCAAHRGGAARREPFIVRIWILPTTAATLPLRRRIEDHARAQPFFAVVEERPMALFAAVTVEGSNEITAGSRGVLGGFLRDGNDVLGVTCGHVADTAGGSVTLEDLNNVQHVGAGTVRHSNFKKLPVSTSSQLCNQYLNNTQPDTDAALIELNSAYTGLDSIKSLGTIDEIYDRYQLNSGSSVWMSGPASGAHDYVIGGYGVTLKIPHRGAGGTISHYCFSHLFEFYDPGHAPGWLPGRIAQAVTRRPLRGESGAWICHKKSQTTYAYFGNLIAVQGATGVATFADALRDWARTQHGLSLTVL